MRANPAAVRDSGRLLDLCESGWAPALRGKVLVAEAEPERHGDLLPAVAAAISRCDAATAAERWPACLLMTVVGAVAAGYRHGSAWAVWWRACGKRVPSAAETAEWERAFRAAATIFGAAAFGDLSGDEAVLLHTGVPDAFLEDLCSTLAEGLGTSVSAPVTLLSGQPEAAAFLNRCREAMAAIGDDGAGWAPELPRRFLDAMADFQSRREGSTGVGRRGLRIEPFGRGPLLVGADGSEAPAAVADVGGRLFVFGEDDTALAENAVLSPATVWLLYPADTPPAVAGTLRVVAHGSLPARWSGWSLVAADLKDVIWLQAGEPGSARRVVGGRGKPALVTGAPLVGLAHGAGRPVFADPPVLRLPAGAAEWSVEVRDRDGGVWVRKQVRGQAEAVTETAAFWDDVPRPLIGEYSVRAGGGDGPGMVRSVALAEALVVERFPDVRLLTAEGLEPAEVVLHPGQGMTAVPAALTLEATCLRLPVDLVTRHRRERFVVEPPRMRVGAEGGTPEADAVRPPRLERAELARGGRLFIELPGSERLPSLEVVADGRVAQSVRPHRDGGYNLRRVLDTVTVHEETVLRLVHDGRPATVAWILDTASAQDPWLPRATGSVEG